MRTGLRARLKADPSTQPSPPDLIHIAAPILRVADPVDQGVSLLSGIGLVDFLYGFGAPVPQGGIRLDMINFEQAVHAGDVERIVFQFE